MSTGPSAVPPSASPVGVTGAAPGGVPARPRKWGFASATLVVLLLVVAGQGVCLVGEPYFRAAKDAWVHGDWARLSAGAAEVGLTRAALFAGFLISAGAWTWLQRTAVLGFFRSMHAGVALVSLTTVAVAVGVLVPQIDGFEDPDQRVTPANRAQQYSAFRWAEAYFLFHLTHLYGIDMPTRELPPQALEGLERYGWRYGLEERDNRRKQMQSAFDSMAKQEALDAFVERHDAWLRRAFDVCTALHLNRTFKSYWFASLLALLAAAVALNLLRGPPRSLFTLQRLGFAVVHTGLLILLAGGWVSKACTDRGILHLELDKPPQNTYWRHHDSSKLARMPFWVRLDRFARQEWKRLEVHFLREEFKSKAPGFTLWKGRKIELDYAPDASGEMRPELELRVRELSQRARVELAEVREGTPDDGAGDAPLVELVVPRAGADPHDHGAGRGEAHDDGDPHGAAAAGGARRLYLTPQIAELRDYVDPSGHFRLRVVGAGTSEPIFPAREGALGALEVDLATRPDAEPMRIEFSESDLGRRLPVADGYELEIVRATQNFRLERPGGPELVDTRPLAEQPQRIAAIEIQVHAPGEAEVERRILIEGIDPVEFDLTGRYVHQGLIATLVWDRWSAPGPPRFALVLGDDAEPRLVSADGGESLAPAGQGLPLPGETPVTLARAFRRARFDSRVEFLPPRIAADGWDEDFYAREPRGLELEVVRWPGTPRERRETVRLTTGDDGASNVWYTPERDVAVVFFEDTQGFPYEWRSVLSIVERDGRGEPYTVPLGSERDREIRVNDYFTHRGYRFFQTNADARFPNYSGIGVVYDPGIEIVLAGMYTIIAGSVIAFLVRPIVRARRRQESAA